MVDRSTILSIATLLSLMSVFAGPMVRGENLLLGIVGLDSSHSEQFTLRLNDPANPNHIPGARVVAFHGRPRPADLLRKTAGFWDRFPHLGYGQVAWMARYWTENGGRLPVG
jgi:hypothetical protein